MIASKIQRHFSKTASHQQNKKSIVRTIKTSNSLEEFDVRVQKPIHEKRNLRKTKYFKEKRQIKFEEEEAAKPETTKKVILKECHITTPLTVPKQRDFVKIPNLEVQMCCQNKLIKKKSNSFFRKVIRKRLRNQSKQLINIESKQSLLTSTELPQELEQIDQQIIGNNDKISLHYFQLSNKEYEMKTQQHKINQFKIDDFNSKIISPTYKLYYTEKLISLLLGEVQDTFMTQMFINHFMQTYEILRKLQYLEVQDQFLPLQKITQQKKTQKTLVIDLDETLVHCNESNLLPKDFIITVNLENQTSVEAEISIRPYAQQFLKNMSQYFEIIIFTASNEDYANQIIDYLDPKKQYVDYRLFRNDCINLSFGCHIKDLRILNRNLKDILLIDNSAYSFAYQLNNGIPIIPFLDNKKDNELQLLEQYLLSLINVEDVRIINQQCFHLQKIKNCTTIQQAVQHLICNRL